MERTYYIKILPLVKCDACMTGDKMIMILKQNNINYKLRGKQQQKMKKSKTDITFVAIKITRRCYFKIL